MGREEGVGMAGVRLWREAGVVVLRDSVGRGEVREWVEGRVFGSVAASRLGGPEDLGGG